MDAKQGPEVTDFLMWIGLDSLERGVRAAGDPAQSEDLKTINAKEPPNTMKPRGKLSKADLARAAERLRHSNPINHFGFQLVKAERGRAVFVMPVSDLHKQIHRVVHGGVLAMLADTAGGFASFLAAPPGSRVVTIEMKINFLEAVERGPLKADARVLRIGRTTSVVDCDVTDQDGRLVSKALMTFSVYRPKV